MLLFVHARVHIVQRTLEMLLEAGSVVEHLTALEALELASVLPSVIWQSAWSAPFGSLYSQVTPDSDAAAARSVLDA